MNQYDAWAEKSAKQWKGPFSLAEKLLSEARHLAELGEVRSNEHLKIVRSLLYGRVLSGTQGVVTLCRFGLLTEGDILFRSNMEALFRLAALVEDESMFSRYLGEDYPRRRKAMGDIRELLGGTNPRPEGAISDADLDAALRDIDREANEFRKKSGLESLSEVKTWDWVQAGKQFDFFFGKYLLQSQVAHHAARDLERRMVKTADGRDVRAIQYHVDTNSPVELIHDALFLLVRAMDLYASSVSVDVGDEARALRVNLDQLLAPERLV